MLRVRFFFPLLIVLAAAAAACGGGGGGGSVIPSGTPTPHAGPTALPVGPTPQVVNLSGGGYNLEFTVPPVVTGTTATMNAVLQSTLPSGTVAPQSSKHGAAAPRKLVAPDIGANVKGLAYLVVSTTATVGFSSAPSFQFTMPAGTSIPSGQSAYLLFWDPNAAGSTGWVALLGPGTVGGQMVTFPGVKTGVNLQANTQYVYALAVTTAPVPTATPAPTPTPTPVPPPQPAATPADCPTNFVSAAGGVPLQVTDDAGFTGAQLIIYATTSSNGQWLNYDGMFDSSTAVPMPAACFSTTLGSAGTKPLNIPSGSPGGHIYFVYAPYSGSATIPNPFAGVPNSGPTVGYAGYKAVPYPWDFIEYGTAVNGTTIDTTQVVSLGLPLELSTGATPLPITTAGPMPTTPPAGVTPAPCPTNGPAAQIVGVTSCNFASVFLAMEQISQYNQLVVAQPFLGTTYDTQILSPAYGGATSFDWNLFADSLPSPKPAACPSTTTNGYLSCILAFYQTNPQLYTSIVAGADPKGSGAGNSVTGDNYCVGSDGTANFTATDVGPTGTCSSTPKPTGTPNPFHINIANFMYGVPPTNDNPSGSCKGALLYGQPWGLANVNNTSQALANAPAYSATGHLFAFEDAFALWKALGADIVYGTAMQTPAAGQTHPIGPSTPGALFTTLFRDPMYDQYDYVLHEYFDSNLSYGLPYDDSYKLDSGVNWNVTNPQTPIDVRINQVPTSAVTLPTSVSPVAIPVPCPTLTPSASPAPIGEF